MKLIKNNNNKIFLHQNDLEDNLKTGDIISIDTETTGLSLQRDRLCLIQLCLQNKDCHIIKLNQIENGKTSKPKNLIKILSDRNVEKVFHFADLILHL